MRRKKSNEADERQEAHIGIRHMSSDNNLVVQQTPIQEDGMNTEEHYAETDRGLVTTSHKWIIKKGAKKPNWYLKASTLGESDEF